MSSTCIYYILVFNVSTALFPRKFSIKTHNFFLEYRDLRTSDSQVLGLKVRATTSPRSALPLTVPELSLKGRAERVSGQTTGWPEGARMKGS